jgi:hypothetical protein
MRRILTALLLLGLGAVGLAGCYVVSPYAYPAPVPVAPAPPYVPPSARGPVPPPSGGPATPPPAGGAAAPAPEPGKNCQTVTVEGHYETRVPPGGQRETVWIPTYTQQLCQ